MLIEHKATGSPEQLANKLNVSKRQVHTYISDLKDLGFQISYSKVQATYYYVAPPPIERNYPFFKH